jgi:hypothetical protein
MNYYIAASSCRPVRLKVGVSGRSRSGSQDWCDSTRKPAFAVNRSEGSMGSESKTPLRIRDKVACVMEQEPPAEDQGGGSSPGANWPAPWSHEFDPQRHIWDGNRWWTEDRSHFWTDYEWRRSETPATQASEHQEVVRGRARVKVAAALAGVFGVGTFTFIVVETYSFTPPCNFFCVFSPAMFAEVACAPLLLAAALAALAASLSRNRLRSARASLVTAALVSGVASAAIASGTLEGGFIAFGAGGRLVATAMSIATLLFDLLALGLTFGNATSSSVARETSNS